MFSSSPTVIVFSTSNEYVSLCAVALHSLMEHRSHDKEYNIIILHQNLSQDSKLILDDICHRKNVSLHFKQLEDNFLENYKSLFYENGYVKQETYYRIFIADIFKEYDKIIYCDSDLVFASDVSKLFDFDIDDNIIAATKNISFIWNFNKNRILYDNITYKDYALNTLKLNAPNNYFQAGVCIFNLKKMRKTHFKERCLSYLEKIKKPFFFDQDILNIICQGDVFFLPLIWNHVWYFSEYSFLLDGLPTELYLEYDAARHSPSIVHYAGPKPYEKLDRPLGGLFWKHALETPYANEFLKKALGPQAEKITVPASLFEGKHIEPVFDDAITVLLSSSSNYACYLGVAVESLLRNRDKRKNYDLIVFETTLNDGQKNSITKRVSKEHGCSIRFINVSELLSSYNNIFYVYNSFSKETYYRLFASSILYSYDKVIYIDADTLVLSDLTELWSTDIDDFYIAGVKDYVLQGYAKNYEVKKGGDIRKYIENVLDLRYQDYIQCGILLMNLKEMRRSGFVEKALNILQLLRKPLFVDQDVLNKACAGKIAILPPRYNFLMYYASRINEIDYSFRAEITADKDNIKIFHMPGGHPDEFPHLELSSLYFSYARESCLYEEIINKMIHVYYLRSINPRFNKIDQRINSEMQNIHNAFKEVRQENENLRHQIVLLKEFAFCHYSTFNYYRYKIMSKITFGSLRKHYKRKYRALKKFRSHALKPMLDQYHI